METEMEMEIKDGIESFVFYESFYKAISQLPETEKLPMFFAICDYALYGKEPKFDGASSVAFCLIKPQLDKTRKRYRKCIENGKMGGRPLKRNLKLNQKKSSLNLKGNLTYNDNYNYNYNDNYNSKSAKFLTPVDRMLKIFQDTFQKETGKEYAKGKYDWAITHNLIASSSEDILSRKISLFFVACRNENNNLKNFTLENLRDNWDWVTHTMTIKTKDAFKETEEEENVAEEVAAEGEETDD